MCCSTFLFFSLKWLKASFFFPRPLRASVPGDRVLPLWRPGGLPTSEQALLTAVLRREEPRWRLPHLESKHPAQPEERVRAKTLRRAPLCSCHLPVICPESGHSSLHCIPSSYVSFGSESDGGYMDMSKDEPTLYVAMQEQIDAIKYADIQPSPYESSYQQNIYQEQGLACALTPVSIHFLR